MSTSATLISLAQEQIDKASEAIRAGNLATASTYLILASRHCERAIESGLDEYQEYRHAQQAPINPRLSFRQFMASEASRPTKQDPTQ